MNTREAGDQGEKKAAEYLTAKGYEIIKTNFHFGRYGEIDLIAKDKGYIVFVEVKMRRGNEYGSALESMSHKKMMALRRAAEGYLYVNKITDVPCRFDFIAIDSSDGKSEITHLENAF